MKAIIYLSTLLCAISPTCAALAKDTITPIDKGDETVITISRQPMPLKQMAQSVSVLDHETLNEAGSGLLIDVLRNAPSTQVISYGGHGQTASVLIRGAGADHTLILLDGIRLNDPSLVGGGSDSGLLGLAAVDHIEFVRGPFSTLWGSGALGGVIALTTKLPQQPLEAELNLTGFDTYFRAQSALGGKQHGLQWRLSSAILRDQGISAFAGGTEKDAFSSAQTVGQLRYRLDEESTLFALTQLSRSRTDFDGFSPPTYDFGDTGDYGKSNTQLATLGYVHKTTWGDYQLSAGLTDATRRNFDDQNALNFNARGQTMSLEAVVNVKLGTDQDLLFGLGTRKDWMSVATPSAWEPNPTPLRARLKENHVFALFRQTLPQGWRLDLGGRLETSHDNKAISVAQLGLVAPLSDTISLKSSLGSGYKVPSLYQRFSDYGNPDLSSERAENGEIGLDYQGTDFSASALYYHRNIKDLIGFASCFDKLSPLCESRPFGYYDNIQKAQSSGLELGLKWRVDPLLSLDTTFNLQSNINRTAGFAHLDLARTPRQMAQVKLLYRPSAQWGMNLVTRYVGKRFEDAANRVSLKPYMTTDIHASYQYSHNIKLTLSLDNVGDSHYQTAKSYGQLGRRLWLGIRWQP